MENDRPPDLSEEALKEVASSITKDWLRVTTRRSYEAWELAQALEKEGIKTGEWWKTFWKWKDGTDDRLQELEDDMEKVKQTQAVSAVELATQIAARMRGSRLLDTVLTGVVVGVVILVVKFLTKSP